MWLFITLTFFVAAAPAFAQSPVVDTAGTGRLIDQAMNHSEVMQNLQHLTDVIGPRLSGSPAMRRANEWTASRFQAYGLSAKLEPYEFGVTWQRGDAAMRLLQPFSRAITAHSWAWTEGTGGKSASRSGGPHGSLHPRKPRGLQVEGEGSLGPAPASVHRYGTPTGRR